MIKESIITIELVHGGYVLRTLSDEGPRSEVFTSTAKLIKALRQSVDDLTLVSKKVNDKAED